MQAACAALRGCGIRSLACVHIGVRPAAPRPSPACVACDQAFRRTSQLKPARPLLSTMGSSLAASQKACSNDLFLPQGWRGPLVPAGSRDRSRGAGCDDDGNGPERFSRARELSHRPSRMSVSVLRGESASGSSLSSITDGLLLSSAAQNAGAKSAVASTV